MLEIESICAQTGLFGGGFGAGIAVCGGCDKSNKTPSVREDADTSPGGPGEAVEMARLLGCDQVVALGWFGASVGWAGSNIPMTIVVLIVRIQDR